MQEYEIQLPERGYQRTPPYTGYIDHEPLKLPGYGERRKPLEKEVPTAYRLPNTNTSLLEQIICSRKISDDMYGTRNTLYCPIIKDDDFSIGITHHNNGFGKIKINDGGKEYGVPLTDVMNLPLGEWRIQRH